MVESASDGVRLGNTLEHLEQMRAEALYAQRHTIDTKTSQSPCELLCHRLGIRLDGELAGRRQRVQQALQRRGLGERRRSPSQEHRVELRREQAALEFQLAQHCVDIRTVLPVAPDDRA